jgi:hypothetical protein
MEPALVHSGGLLRLCLDEEDSKVVDQLDLIFDQGFNLHPTCDERLGRRLSLTRGSSWQPGEGLLLARIRQNAVGDVISPYTQAPGFDPHRADIILELLALQGSRRLPNQPFQLSAISAGEGRLRLPSSAWSSSIILMSINAASFVTRPNIL